MKIKLFILVILFANVVFAQNNIHITSDSVELDGNANEVIASGNVVVVQNDISLKSGFVKYNQLTQIARLYEHVELTKENLTLHCDSAIAYGIENVIEADGHINVNYESVKAEADHAYFDVNTHLITLTGNPVAFQEGGYIKGESIIVDLDNIKVTTIGKAEVKLNLDKI
jgi:lipopolysaccharide export system protein LptA